MTPQSVLQAQKCLTRVRRRKRCLFETRRLQTTIAGLQWWDRLSLKHCDGQRGGCVDDVRLTNFLFFRGACSQKNV